MVAMPPTVYPAHATAKCCWCRLPLIKIVDHWWCQTRACRDRQRSYGIVFKKPGTPDIWWHVPLPIQVVAESHRAKNLLFGGPAGPGKSHYIRRRAQRRAMAYNKYRGVILRRHKVDLESTHLSFIETEVKELRAQGIRCHYVPMKRVEFEDTNSVIHFGHLATKRALEQWLSTNYDDVLVDEASTIKPSFLPELSTRARTDNPAIILDGGAKFLLGSNPGGEATVYLDEMFIEHLPNYEDFPQLIGKYDPNDWAYVEARLEDNPYLEPDYADKRLANVSAIRYQQLRYANWKVFEGQFFKQLRPTFGGQPWHVRAMTPAVWATSAWFRSIKWSRGNPCCCIWWAALANGQLCVIADLRRHSVSIPSFVKDIQERDRELQLNHDLYRYTAAAPVLWGTDRGESTAETFALNGIPLSKASDDRVQGYGRVSELFSDIIDNIGPRVVINETCTYVRKSMPILKEAKLNRDDIDQGSDTAAADAMMAAAMSRPSSTVLTPEEPGPGTLGADLRAAREAMSEYITDIVIP